MITFRTLGKLGRFGNQLFQYTGTRMYAELNDYSWAFPDWIGTAIFQDVHPYTAFERLHGTLLPTIQLSDMHTATPLQRLQLLARLRRRGSIQELHEHPQDNINIYGYLQDPFSLGLLSRHARHVRSFLKFKPNIEQAFRDATEKYAPWIGVHIRRGDFVKRGLAVPTSLYEHELEKQPQSVPLYISSDSIGVKKELARFRPITPTNPLPHIPDFIFDFWMLANASTVYGCGSTFSWWAAYLGGKNSYYSPLLTHLWPRGYVPALHRQLI